VESAAAIQPPAYDGPVEPIPEAPPRKRHSTGMMVGGIVMTSFVPIALLAALVANAEQTNCESSNYFGGGTLNPGTNCEKYDATIYGGLGAAVLLAGVGIPMIVIGGKKEPAHRAATLTPWATPQAAGLGLRLDL
jgi:hypothetical protein